MQKAFDLIVARLEEAKPYYNRILDSLEAKKFEVGQIAGLNDAIEIVKQVAEEYKSNPNLIDEVKVFLKEKFDYCSEQAFMELEAECDSEIASYFRERKELYLDRANIYGEVMRVIDRLQDEHCNDGWIPCSSGKMPMEHDSIFANYRGTKKWNDAMFEKISDEVNVTVVDEKGNGTTTHAHTVDGKWECDLLKCNKTYKVLAWQPLPQPYKPKFKQKVANPISEEQLAELHKNVRNI